jgi:transcription antitermination factor NusG
MPNHSAQFSAGDRITIVQGPYTDFKGIVVNGSPAPGKVGVKLAFFGRKAHLTLDASAVAPLPKGH